jgi:hypothetical protein
MEIVEGTCRLPGAVLDINLRGDMVFLVAAALIREGPPGGSPQ